MGVSASDDAVPVVAPGSLTHGLARNTAFNVLGWVVPVILYIVATPLIVHGLGTEPYGVFGIVSIAAGYFGFLNSASAAGNIRFLAEAYGRRDWDEFHDVATAGVILSGSIGLAAGLLIALAAPFLVTHAFKIPPELTSKATLCIRLAGLGFFVNSVIGALTGVPTAVRRYDLVNGINLVAGLGSTLGVALAVQFGYGLVGAVAVQVASSIVSLLGFVAATWWLLHTAGQVRAARIHGPSVRRIFSFSALLSLGQIGTTIGLQMDRTVVAALLGPAAVTFYSVPQRIAEQVTGLLGKLTTTLYPLAAEGSGADLRDAVKDLYMSATRAVVWLAALMTVPLIALSHDIMLAWMGQEFADKSTGVLVALAIAVVFRASTTVSSPVCMGLGRADVAAAVGWCLCISYSVPVFLLARRFGVVGAAAGCVLGMAPLAIGFDFFVQRRLLNQMRWAPALGTYLKPLASGAIVLFLVSIAPFHDLAPWPARIAKLLVAAGLILSMCLLLERKLIRRILAHLPLNLRVSRP